MELLKSDIFFFITSISVVLLTIGIIIAIVFILRILRKVEHISDWVIKETENLGSDIYLLRRKLQTESQITFSIMKSIISLFIRKNKKNG